MSQSLSEYIHQLPILDIHEHHLPETFLSNKVGLLDLFKQSYAGWTQARPYPLPGETIEDGLMDPAEGETTWEDIVVYTEDSGSNQFVRSLIHGLDELYELKGEGITKDNWQSLDQEIRKRHEDPDWPHEVLRRAGVTRIITDPYSGPMQNARETLGDHYQSVLRINALAMGWHPDNRDHNGNCASEFAKALNLSLDSFEDYSHLIDVLVDTLADRNQVAVKNALAYDRDIQFDPPDETLARSAWKNINTTPEERKAFGDFVVDRFCTLAGERDVPVQVHLGCAVLHFSHPMKLVGLIERHPKTRFLLMHLAYPWTADLMGICFVYRNVWIDLTWSHLISGSHFKRFLHEAIEVLHDETRIMFGGDNWHAEESFSTFKFIRKLISEVLQEKVDSGYFLESDARRLAEKIFTTNAIAFFGLDD